MKKTLLIGPLENRLDPTKTGGVIVIFSDLLRQFEKERLKYFVIDTNKANYSNRLSALLHIWFMLLIKIRHFSHISLHGTANDYMFIAPVTVFLAKIFKKSVSLRKFAGNFDEIYANMNFIIKLIVSLTLKKSDVIFFETKYLVKYFLPLNKNTHWFPNVREKPSIVREGIFKKRFIFIGNITREKGIIELLETSNLLSDDYTIHLYGNINNDLLGFDFSNYKAEYKRALNHKEVLKTLCEYDVLILPSYREGYPGVIIEALSVGLPIIATKLEGIKEMVDNKSTMFIEPKNINQLKSAIESFSENTYAKRSAAALEQFNQFESDYQTERFFSKINLL